ncbi:hypothetical protein WISP_84269 [Willisornis vidua]|uniref:Uncharacterized protein n=1 Tax=Willisornis vidua TaxID=1566151 RepID=A0ABQ9D8U2_9PASS|nr:hypothetical protein WISP_84269 [Willisornis vidua]
MSITEYQTDKRAEDGQEISQSNFGQKHRVCVKEKGIDETATFKGLTWAPNMTLLLHMDVLMDTNTQPYLPPDVFWLGVKNLAVGLTAQWSIVHPTWQLTDAQGLQE